MPGKHDSRPRSPIHGARVRKRAPESRSGEDLTIGPAGQPGSSSVCHDSVVNAASTAKPPRSRLDQLLVDRGLVENRTRAQALVLAGKVRVGDGDSVRRDLKPGDLIDGAMTVEVVAPEPYVSRGGHKLAAALDAFEIDVRDLVAMDVGASTGGFTDVLLQRGARRVYAIDVGRGQLADTLRRDERVVSMERLNARTLAEATLPEPIAIATIDVAFISLELILGPVHSTLLPVPSASIVALVKPQFEVGRGGTDHGVVRDPAVHRQVLERVIDHAATIGLGTRAVIASPLLGPQGNREFLIHLAAGPGCAEIGLRMDEATAP